MLSSELYIYLIVGLTIVLSLSIGGELWARWRLYAFCPKDRPLPLAKEKMPVSVLLLCEHNNKQATMSTLYALAEQIGVVQEIHVLAYAATPEIEEEIERYSQSSPYPIRYTLLPQTMKNIGLRKMAITIGTKSARNDTIVLVQAGVIPRTQYWLYAMAQEALTSQAYAGSVFLAPTTSYSSTLHYLYALLGLATTQARPTTQFATEQNFTYSKVAFLTNKKVFSQDLDTAGGEALIMLNNCVEEKRDTPKTDSTNAMAYNYNTPSHAALTLQETLRTIASKYPRILQKNIWLSRIMAFSIAVAISYSIVRLLGEQTPSFHNIPLCDTIVIALLLAQYIIHTLAFKRLSKNIRLKSKAYLAYWHALMLPLHLYYYQRIFRIKSLHSND